MAQQPHETPEFQHAAEFTIAVTFVVAGGKRSRTANQRAQRILEQIANYTARVGQLVEVTAVGGPSHKGKITWPSPIAFSVANTDPLPVGKPNRFHRYLDPERDRALRSVAEVNAAQRARKEADRQRRLAACCHNAHPSVLDGPRYCRCIYYDPQTHPLALRATRRGEADPLLRDALRVRAGGAHGRPALPRPPGHRGRGARRRPCCPPAATRPHDFPMSPT